MGTAYIRFVVSETDLGSPMFQPHGRRVFRDVGAANHETQVEHELGDTAHTGAADPDEVDILDLVLHRGDRHAVLRYGLCRCRLSQPARTTGHVKQRFPGKAEQQVGKFARRQLGLRNEYRAD
jgi:hypothetical protein